MKTVVFAATKGGVGKSTLCAAIAVMAAQDRRKVAMLDLDPQGSLSQWFARRLGDEPADDANPELYAFQTKDGFATLPEAVEVLSANGLDWLFVDTGPGLLQRIEAAVGAADLVIIPVKTSAFDLEAIDPVLDVAQGSKRPYLMVLNEIDPRATKMNTSARAYLTSDGHAVAEQIIPQRLPYRAALTKGLTGPEVDRDGRCAEEIKALWSEMKKAVAKGARKHGG